MTDKRCALIVFCRAPIPGRVKTRLIPGLGAAGAASLYRSLVVQTLVTASASDVGDIRLYCTPAITDPFLQTQASDFDLTLHLQSGNDLGERMHGALAETLQGYDAALVIGCDCPALSIDDLNLACKKLISGYELVIGPAEDGGYYLIGMHHANKAIFEGIGWEQADVMSKTRERIRKLGLKTHELAEHWDLDRPEDLERYYQLYPSRLKNSN